jgi:hypothetical protein
MTGIPKCDNCLLKADFDTNTPATCSDGDPKAKFYDYTLTPDTTKLNTHIKYFFKITLAGYN